MRSDEEASKVALTRLLVGAGEKPEWEAGRDPPDYALVVRGTRYAVEMTQVQQTVRRGSFGGSEQLVRAVYTSFIERAAERAFDDDLVRGCYWVSMEPIEKFRERSPLIELAFRRFLADTRDHEKTENRVLWGRAWGSQWKMRKIDHRDALIYPNIRMHGVALFTGEILRILKTAVADRVLKKARLLEHIGKPKILVLIDEFGLPDDDHWPRALRDVDTSAWHSIVRTGGSSPPRVLQSLNAYWVRIP